ncbi:unnamed protein product, partial [marine sediment metagenome]
KGSALIGLLIVIFIVFIAVGLLFEHLLIPMDEKHAIEDLKTLWKAEKEYFSICNHYFYEFSVQGSKDCYVEIPEVVGGVPIKFKLHAEWSEIRIFPHPDPDSLCIERDYIYIGKRFAMEAENGEIWNPRTCEKINIKKE